MIMIVRKKIFLSTPCVSCWVRLWNKLVCVRLSLSTVAEMIWVSKSNREGDKIVCIWIGNIRSKWRRHRHCITWWVKHTSQIHYVHQKPTQKEYQVKENKRKETKRKKKGFPALEKKQQQAIKCIPHIQATMYRTCIKYEHWNRSERKREKKSNKEIASNNIWLNGAMYLEK